MADKDDIVGRWTVRFRNWVWEYTFLADGKVSWRDPLNNENGSGRWGVSPTVIFITWSNSTTKETWQRPVKPVEQIGFIDASYGKGAFKAVKVAELTLPGAATGDQGLIDMDLDPVTGEFVATGPAAHPKYIEKVFTAVEYGVMETGYNIYTSVIELPVHTSVAIVDFSLAKAEQAGAGIFNSYAEAKKAAADGMGQRRVAYFWGAGGAVVCPTIIGPATAPQLHATMVRVRNLRDHFVSIMVPALTMAIGMIGGPKPMPVNGGGKTSRVVKRIGAKEPPRSNLPPPPKPKIKPFNGQVSVGGGFENKSGSNLNPINPNSGGPSKGIPNHVRGGMEDMGNLFEKGSVEKMISSRLRYGDVNWQQGTRAAAGAMKPGGKVAMNIWCQGAAEQRALKTHFEAAGFKNVKIMGDGTGTMLFADF